MAIALHPGVAFRQRFATTQGEVYASKYFKNDSSRLAKYGHSHTNADPCMIGL
jgi:hypothetical protein